VEEFVEKPLAQMSKLEIKLAKGRKEKREADLKKAEEDERVRIEEEKLAAEQKIVDERIRVAKELEKAARAAEIEEESEEDDDEPEAASTGGSEDPAIEAEREKRMRATMFGDEVFSEYSKPEQPEVDGEGVTVSKRKEKVSNKMKRKLAKEADSKEREAEYNLAAINASAQGAQFACSQSIIDPNDLQWQNALDIIIPNLSISAHSKVHIPS
jgi:hypothetical protein